MKHLCHWPGCQVEVLPRLWGCKSHWFALPLALRNRIWHNYRPGQEVDKRPSAEYLKVAQEVQDWIIARNLGVPQEIQLEVAQQMGEALELHDGRYYATARGCELLEQVMAKRGLKVKVEVGADGRFVVT